MSQVPHMERCNCVCAHVRVRVKESLGQYELMQYKLSLMKNVYVFRSKEAG